MNLMTNTLEKNNMDYYITIETAKQLKDWRCNIPANSQYFESGFVSEVGAMPDEMENGVYPRYHILEDICVSYAKEFFGKYMHDDNTDDSEIPNGYLQATIQILKLIQQNKKQEAEEYLLRHTIFNPKNKTI